MRVGGNIRWHTRTMTTTIALETSRGDLALVLGLGLILVALTLLVSDAAFLLDRRMSDHRNATRPRTSSPNRVYRMNRQCWLFLRLVPRAKRKNASDGC